MDNGSLFGALSVYIGLFATSLFYDHCVAWLEVKRLADGRTAYLVVFGVAYTLLGLGLLDVFIDLNAGVLAVTAFIASGLPMIIGSVRRYTASKDHGLNALIADLGSITRRMPK